MVMSAEVDGKVILGVTADESLDFDRRAICVLPVR